MAQYKAGTAVGPGAAYDFLVQMRDHMVANGWTVLFTVNANPGNYDFYMRSAPLDVVADNRSIIRFTQTATTQFYTRTYADWDSVANVGWNEVGTVGITASTVADASFAYWIKANSVSVAWCCKISTNYNKNYAGFLRRGLSSRKGGVTKSIGALAIGATSIPVATDMTNKLKVGQKIHVLNYAHSNASANKVNGEVVTITSITGGGSPSIGVSALTKGYDSGALIGQNPMPSIVSAATNSSSPITNAYSCWHVDGSAPANTSDTTNGVAALFDATNEQNMDPNDGTQDYFMSAWLVNSSVNLKNGFRGYLYHWESATSNSQGVEDIMDDGEYTYLVLGAAAANCCALGPREV